MTTIGTVSGGSNSTGSVGPGVTPAQGATETHSSSSSGAAGPGTSRGALDRDAFLRLLVAQLSHQDPLQPVQGTEFVTQLAQFASVEQAVAQTTRLDMLSTQLRGISYNNAAQLAGQEVTVRGNEVAFDGSHATPTSVSLQGAATNVTVTLRDASGRAIRTLRLGAHAAGPMPVSWDGRDDAGNVAPRGTYRVDVRAENSAGAPVNVVQDVTGRVLRVTFDHGYPELVLDNGTRAPVSQLVSVSAPTTRR